MKELVLYIAKSLADKPDEVKATQTEEDHAVVVNLVASDSDKGRIIGKQGKVIRAIRTLAAAALAKTNKKAIVNVE